MYTVMDSPVGDLRIVERGGAITADRVLAVPRTHDGRPLGEREDDHPVLAEAIAQLGRTSPAS